MTFEQLNALGTKRTPFLFYTDFTAEQLHVILLDELAEHDIAYTMDRPPHVTHPPLPLAKSPVSFETYRQKFEAVIEQIKQGNTYLLNLTQPTPIATALNLQQIYERAHAPFKLRVGNQFACFSPERFIRIADDTIETYPMKGTIDASIDNAESKILANTKEMAEHVMVVDLLRNDLGIVADNIRVERFRYTQTIQAGDKTLVQVSSHIAGDLNDNWHDTVGSILKALLPAGSISGTPKKRTVELIRAIEGYDRGFFSGVFGVYDGQSLDSAVMIRYVEQTTEGLVYKSGGGITLESQADQEYREMLDKIYIA